MTRVILAAALVVVVSLVPSARPNVSEALADSGPVYPAAGTLTTAGKTLVQMTSEKVLVNIEPTPGGRSEYQARVDAEFQLYNPGPATSLLVGYPESVWTPAAAVTAQFQFKTVEALPITAEGLAVKVDEQPVAAVSKELVQEDVSESAFQAGESWFVWPMDFEPGASHLVRVSFEQVVRGGLEGKLNCGAYRGMLCFDYVLVTGAGWDGPIGDAEISVQFPEDIDLDTFYAASPMPFGPTDQAVVQRQGQKVIWQNRDFEPGDNFSIAFLSPEASAELRRARQIAAPSNDAADHGRLAELLFSLTNSPEGQVSAFNPGNDRLLSEGMLEVARGLALDPNSAAVWSAMLSLESKPSDTPSLGTLRAIVTAERLLQLDPTNEEARSFLEGVQQYGLGSLIDPQAATMVRDAASLALAGAGPSGAPPTGAGGLAASSAGRPRLGVEEELAMGLAAALGLAALLVGICAAHADPLRRSW
ncbi:MAG: hypothetical protein MUP14_05310 [Dehalococcoidia bacterium]|nr:hypothetical protein [Dehalococcoidia bacterium]